MPDMVIPCHIHSRKSPACWQERFVYQMLRGLQVWVTIAALLNYEVVRLNTVRD